MTPQVALRFHAAVLHAVWLKSSNLLSCYRDWVRRLMLHSWNYTRPPPPLALSAHSHPVYLQRVRNARSSLDLGV